MTMESLALELLKSWSSKDSNVCPNAEILRWVKQKNRTTYVKINKTVLKDDGFWYYNKHTGAIQNRNESFFKIMGLRSKEGDSVVEQPIILQNEIGYLGIIMKPINGILHCLMQAKIEPGNVNKIQLSPTIQATKSNFTQLHGGNKPAYLDYFINVRPEQLVVDQIQSEQASCFYKKRNRNIIVLHDEKIEVLPSHRWMTIGQIKEMMKYNNLVNMDTRTVLSCIPYCMLPISFEQRRQAMGLVTDPALFRSIFDRQAYNLLPAVYGQINDIKMFHQKNRYLVSLSSLQDWGMINGELRCKKPAPFKVIFCDITIEGREVKHWTQPLFAALDMWTFGLICYEWNGRLMFLVRAKEEIGAFDQVELGPTIQQQGKQPEDAIARLFWDALHSRPKTIVRDVMLSEEGGRFYHEQNRNVLVRLPAADIPALPKGYFALDYYTLNQLIQINNCANIQLRNLLSFLEV